MMPISPTTLAPKNEARCIAPLSLVTTCSARRMMAAVTVREVEITAVSGCSASNRCLSSGATKPSSAVPPRPPMKSRQCGHSLLSPL